MPTYTGTALRDVINGSAEADIIYGLEGDDRLVGGGGDDSIEGGDGDDVIKGGEGEDSLLGGIGNDNIDGGDGDDRLSGGEGDDIVQGGFGYDVIKGGDGNDQLFGGSFDDNFDYESGFLDGGAGNDYLDGTHMFGGDGDDILIYRGGGGLVSGGAGVDLMIAFGTLSGSIYLPTDVENLDAREVGGDVEANDLDNFILLGGGANFCYSEGGNDTVYGNDGDDILNGGGGQDQLYGGAGFDNIFGADGDDVMFGGDGIDQLFGGAGNNILYGEAGEDRLIPRNGISQMYGGADADYFLFYWEDRATSRSTASTIMDFSRAQGDKIDVTYVDRTDPLDFIFIGTTAFTGAGHEVRYSIGSTHTKIDIDIDGDQRTDLLIMVLGQHAFTADDFYL